MPDVSNQNQLQRFIASLAKSRFFVVSLLIHLVLVGIFGSLVIFKAIQEQEAFTVAMNGDTAFFEDSSEAQNETGEALEFEEPKAAESVIPPAQSAISSLVQTSTWSTSASMETMTTGISAASYVPGNLGTTGGGGSGGGGRGGGTGKMASLFGKEIQSAKLGVVFDVSFSTHKTIDSALREIQTNFPDALVVLAPGCGMLKTKNGRRVTGKIIAGGEFMQDLEKYRFDNVKFYMGRFLPALLEGNKSFARMWSDGIRQNRLQVLHLDRPKSADPIIYGTQLAFKYLSDQGVDTIWWFADFEDEIDEEEALLIGRELERRNIKVIQHDFDGGNQLDLPAKRALATLTNGDIIVGDKK